MFTSKEPTKADQSSDHIGASAESEQASAPTDADGILPQGGDSLHPTPTEPISEPPVRPEPAAPISYLVFCSHPPPSGDDDDEDDDFIPRGKPTPTVAGGGKKGAGRP
ncbi:hypothetical protein C8Q74DRAFT_208389 [Fomes fomentarius]|nr:hypothetical protein C8Q74DRAFT_208389 [Fomes fomentarius]